MRLLRNLGYFFVCIASVFSQPSFLSVDVVPAPLIEWDQQPNTFYTGQTMNITWVSDGFLSTDLARITYPGAGGTRTLTTGSGTLITNGFYALRLSDSANGVATSVPVTVTFATNTSIFTRSNQMITVIQSKLMNIVALDGTRILGGGQNTVCDDRNLTVQWRGLGEAQFGVASLSLNRQGGGGGSSTLGTSLTNLPISGNNTFTFVCPRASTPSTFSSYAFQISVQEPGGSAYTGTSSSFNVATAPTPSPSSSVTPTSTPTPTPTPTQTPTSSETPTSTPTPTPSISLSNTPTPTPTPSSSRTPSTTPSAAASIDYVAIARNAAASVDTTTPAIAGAFGGIGGIILLIGFVRWYQHKRLTDLRMKKLAMSTRFVREAQAMYGLGPSQQNHPDTSIEPKIVMYSVAGLPPRSTDQTQLTSIKKGFAPKPIPK